MRVWFPAIRANSGSDVYTERLASGLRASGIDSEITWFPSYFEFFPELMRCCIPVKNFDLIHANSWNASVFIGMNVPVVATVHHLVHDPKFDPYRSLMQAAYHRANVYWRERKSIRECNAVVSVSEGTANAVNVVFGRESQVIHNWLDHNFGDGYKQKSENTKFIILIVGNSGKRKGSDLLPMLSALVGSDYEIRVTGGLRSKGGSIKRVGNIVYLGSLSESKLLSEYAQCDAVISLSRYEGFGYSALEAMSFGKPFIGFETNGLSEVVEDEITGFLVRLNDVDKIVEKIKFLRERPGLGNEMGRLGKLRAKQIFAESIAVGKYINLYQSLLNK